MASSSLRSSSRTNALPSIEPPSSSIASSPALKLGACSSVLGKRRRPQGDEVNLCRSLRQRPIRSTKKAHTLISRGISGRRVRVKKESPINELRSVFPLGSISSISTVSTLVEPKAEICRAISRIIDPRICRGDHQPEVGREDVKKFVVRPSWLQACGCIDDDYAYFADPSEHVSIDSCNQDCICEGGSKLCPCVVNRTTCDVNCQCSTTCERKYPACQCVGACGRRCSCHAFNRACGPACNCKRCNNNFDELKFPPLRVQPSTINNAGQGLFAGTALAKGTLLGEYTGVIIDAKNSTEQEEVIRDFQITKDKAISPDVARSLLFKMNHSVRRKNVAYLAMKTSQGWRVFASALKDIEPGSEIFVDYGFQPTFAKAPEMRLVPKMTFEVEQTNEFSYKVVDTKTNDSAGWHALKPHYRYTIKDTIFRVNDNVFVLNGKIPRKPISDETERDYLARMLKHCWLARILEIRESPNHDPDKAYFVIVWYDQTPAAARNKKKLEFFGTHHVQIVRGSSLASPVAVKCIGIRSRSTPNGQIFYRAVRPSRKGSLIDPKEDVWLAPPDVATRLW